MRLSMLLDAGMTNENIGAIVIAVAVAIGAIAFIAGFVKGFTRIGWGPLIWACACAGFWALETYCRDKNPVLKIAGVAELDAGVQNFVSTLSIALVCILAALFVFGLLGLTRPRRGRKVSAAMRRAGKDPYEDEEIDEDAEDGDGEVVSLTARKRRVGAFNRLLGGLTSLVNVALVLAALAATAAVILNVTSLRDGALKELFAADFMEKIFPYLQRYTLDFLLIAVTAAIAYGGFRCGFRSVFLFVATIAGIVVAFWLPFSKFPAEQSWLSFVDNLSAKFGELILKTSLPENVSVILGKVACGLILCIGICIVVALVGWALKLIFGAARRVGILRLVDNMLASVVLLAFGAAISVLIMAVFYVLEYYGIFEGSRLFAADSPLCRGFYNAFDAYLRPWLENLAAQFS